MESKDIRKIREILEFKDRKDLSGLLKKSSSEIFSSGTYGRFWNSLISTFIVYSPLESFYKLKELNKKDRTEILKAILDIYPKAPESPEIRSLEFRLDTAETENENLENESQISKTIRVFMSYSTKDKDIVGEIKSCLEKYGISVFIAHEDIEPSLEWQEIILQELDSTDIFIPIFTENFSDSPWTDQESGIAFSKGKFIIPVSIGPFSPYGFINKFQSLKFDLRSIEASCKNIINVIANNKRFTYSLLDSLIKLLSNINKFDDAGNIFSLLVTFPSLSTDQLKDLIKSSSENNQIYWSRTARPYLLKIIADNQTRIDKNALKELREKFKSG